MEEGMGLLLLLLLGLTTPALAALKGFHFVNQAKNWTEAQSYCRDKFTDLATIHTQDDWTTVREMLANSSHSFAWLGLYDDTMSWRWSLDNTSLYSRDLGSWFQFTEYQGNFAELCADFDDGRLSHYSCEFPQSSVCYNETTGSYIPVTDGMSWQRAQSYCRERYTDLASIRDQQELNAISNVTDRIRVYWIGLSREGWKWSDRSDSSFRHWASGEPNGGNGVCGAAAVDGWYDHHCGSTFPFICSGEILHVEVPPVQHSLVLRVTVETNGSLNMKDPLVQEAILKQMREHLRAQGVTQPLSLSWRKQPNGQVFNVTEG